MYVVLKNIILFNNFKSRFLFKNILRGQKLVLQGFSFFLPQLHKKLEFDPLALFYQVKEFM